MQQGIDYAFAPHPAPAAIAAGGYRFACRYMSASAANDGNGKNLLAAELGGLLEAGLSVVVVSESAAGRMLSGAPAGTADAQHAKAVTAALGIGAIPVYFACDFDATEANQSAISAYLGAAAGVIGAARVGIYGGFYPVKRALDAGKARWAWQTSAWSGGQWDPRAHIRQHGTVSVLGVQVDADEAMTADFGQWPRPAAATAPSPAPSWPAGLTLRQGDTGAAVRVLQQALHDSGAYGARGLEPVDGIYGAGTVTAVRNFQADKHLFIDGIAGVATRAALGA